MPLIKRFFETLLPDSNEGQGNRMSAQKIPFGTFWA